MRYYSRFSGRCYLRGAIGKDRQPLLVVEIALQGPHGFNRFMGRRQHIRRLAEGAAGGRSSSTTV
jgi:hypothetical protein